MTASYFRRGRGRSRNAEAAQASGRFPATRAAAELGVSPAAFKAGVARAGFRPREWHHVGKFAAAVDFFDLEDLAADWLFWLGAASAYRGPRRIQMLRRAALARARDNAAERWETLLLAWRGSNRKPRAARLAEIIPLCPDGARRTAISLAPADLSVPERVAAAITAGWRAAERSVHDRFADRIIGQNWADELGSFADQEVAHARAWWVHAQMLAGVVPDPRWVAGTIKATGHGKAAARWAAAEILGVAHEPRSLATIAHHGSVPDAFLAALAAAQLIGRDRLVLRTLEYRASQIPRWQFAAAI